MATTPPKPQPTPVVVQTKSELKSIVPQLADLSANTEFKSYKEEQWQYLMQAGNVTAVILYDDKGKTGGTLLGCVLRIGYGNKDAAFGMMLVSPSARGHGLGRLLLHSALTLDDDNDGMRILATCGRRATPMYQRMGFERVGDVTKLCAAWDELVFDSTTTVPTELARDVTIQIDWDCDSSEFCDKVVRLDRTATGLDRSETISAVLSYPKVMVAAAFESGADKLLGCAVATRNTNGIVVVGPVLGQEDLALPLLRAIHNAHCRREDFLASEMSIIISDHHYLVACLKKVGFRTVFELGAMTLGGVPMPGDRDVYLALIHPTLG